MCQQWSKKSKKDICHQKRSQTATQGEKKSLLLPKLLADGKMHIEFRYVFTFDYSTVRVSFHLITAAKWVNHQSHRAEQRHSGKDEPQVHSTLKYISQKW